MSKKHPPQGGVALLYSFNTQSRGAVFLVTLIWALGILLILFYVFLFGSFLQSLSAPHDLKVVSYNIWNYHSYWNTRKKGVAEVIRLAYPDIAILQEVRSSEHNKQLDDLMALLPFFKYSAFAVATPNADFNSAEGLGILSRHPITEVDQYNFTIVHSDGDKNTRTCLRVTIDIPQFGKLQVYVTHLSYERTTQCRQMAELITYIEKAKIYADYEAPSDILTKPFSSNNPCYPHLRAYLQNQEGGAAKFIDVWRELHPNDPGLTFSLMPFKDAEHFVPSKGLESRPDRIYLKTDSCVLHPTSIHRTAGDVYDSKYHNQILSEQLYVHLAAIGWPYVIYFPPLLFILFALVRMPRLYMVFALTSAIYIFTHVKDFPSNPDDFSPSDHLALVSTFAKST